MKDGLIFDIQRFSIHDGPGIRTVVFMKGCPLGCKWCSNPESQSSYPQIMAFDMKCILCGRCVEVCPKKAITIIDGTRKINWSDCNQCLECVKVCPSGAIEQVGRYMSADKDLLNEVVKDSLFYSNSGGGVTFSGGEPLNQWEFVKESCRLCKERGIHTALETSGYAKWDVLEQVLEYVDLVLYDLKHTNKLKHIDGVGVSNDIIIANLNKTAAQVKTWLRLPLIPTFNDSESFLKDAADLAKKLGVAKLSILSYHEWGKTKYSKLGRPYPFEGVTTIPDELISKYAALFQSYGLKVDIGK